VQLGKIKCAAQRWICALGCSSFDFLKRGHFVFCSWCQFYAKCSFRVRHNGRGLCAGRVSEHKVSIYYKSSFEAQISKFARQPA